MEAFYHYFCYSTILILHTIGYLSAVFIDVFTTFVCLYPFQFLFLVSFMLTSQSEKQKCFYKSLHGCILFDEQKIKYLIYCIKFLLSSKSCSTFVNVLDGFLQINICV